VKVDIYSDVTCPWCYLGKRRFEAALADFAGRDDVQVEFKPFQLDPVAPHEPVPSTQALAAKFGTEDQARAAVTHVSGIAAKDGIQLDLVNALTVNTFPAHRVLWLAGQNGLQAGVAERLFAAQQSEREDLSDPVVLDRLAAEVGLPGVAEFLAGDGGVEEVKESIGEARALGIEAVPTYVFDERWAVSGAQPVEVFSQLLVQVADATIGATAGACCGGGCCGS